MSLKPMPIPPVPEEMARVARAVFPRGNVFMQLRDALGTIYTDEAKARSVSHTWPASFGAVAPGTGHRVPIHGALDGSAGRRRRARPTGLEIRPQLGIDRSWL